MKAILRPSSSSSWHSSTSVLSYLAQEMSMEGSSSMWVTASSHARRVPLSARLSALTWGSGRAPSSSDCSGVGRDGEKH